jgi:hypothetical protein
MTAGNLKDRAKDASPAVPHCYSRASYRGRLRPNAEHFMKLTAQAVTMRPPGCAARQRASRNGCWLYHSRARHGAHEGSGGGLTSQQKCALITYLASPVPKPVPPPPPTAFCSAASPPLRSGSHWSAWGVISANTRFQSAAQAGLAGAFRGRGWKSWIARLRRTGNCKRNALRRLGIRRFGRHAGKRSAGIFDRRQMKLIVRCLHFLLHV